MSKIKLFSKSGSKDSREKGEQITEIFEKYRQGKEHHQKEKLYAQCERCYNFYSGNQWQGLESGNEEMPSLNIIKPVGRYKISMVAQNQMEIVYSVMGDNSPESDICNVLNKFASQNWEKLKLDKISWDIIKNAFITGEHYAYFFAFHNDFNAMPQLKLRLIQKTSVYFGDEEEPQINSQPYIIIAERRTVIEVKKTAKANGISTDEIELITPDDDAENGKNSDNKNSDNEKCTSVLYMEKTDSGIKYCRSVKNVIYEENFIEGLKVYPLVCMKWEEQINSARGLSGVLQMIPNQLEINKTLARRSVAVKRFSFPTIVYDKNAVKNIGDLGKVGASIAVDGFDGKAINSIITYLNPAPISNDAERLQQELISQTRELEGAGDAATGQIDPTKASGEAIRAARDQAAVPLNEQTASYKQFIEDMALLWFELLRAYTKDSSLSQQLINADVQIKIDVSPVDPFSKLSQEIALERLMTSQKITFEEYVEALDDSSSVPKAKLQKILEKRTAMQNEMSTMPNGNVFANEQVASVGGQLPPNADGSFLPPDF